MSPLISIIIPNYNSDSTIERTVQSLLSQSYSNWEAIMVDDGSIYDSVLKIKEICARDARFHFFERERLPKGASSCRNIGLAKATGEFIIFLDSDDELLPFCLEERLSKIKTAPDNRFWVFPLATNYKNVFTEKKIPNSNDYLDSFLSYHLYWGIMCPIWNVKFIREIGGFSEELLRLTDPELMIRAMISTNKFEVYNDVKADSIYYIQDKTDKLFNDKVYKSLLAFIPMVSKELENKNLEHKKPFLKAYLKMWMIQYVFNIKKVKNFQTLILINVFSKYGVIAWWQGIIMMLNIMFHSVFQFFANIFESTLRKYLNNKIG